MTDVYPCTIIATRYQGVYEGGQWAAFAWEPWAIDPRAMGNDIDAEEFWSDDDTEAEAGIAVGPTPQIAYERLRDQMDAVENRDEPWPTCHRGAVPGCTCGNVCYDDCPACDGGLSISPSLQGPGPF